MYQPGIRFILITNPKVLSLQQIVQYKGQVEGQKKEEGKPIEIEEVKEWEIEKILNKRKIRGVDKYLV